MASWIWHPCAAFTVCRGSVPAGKEKSCPSRQKGSRNGCAPKFHKPEKMASQFNISSLSLAGQSVTIIQAGLLALGHRLPRLPDSISATLSFARQYSGGTAPPLHRSPLLSPVGRLYVLFNCGVATPLTRYFKHKIPSDESKGINTGNSAKWNGNQVSGPRCKNLLPILRGSNGDCQTGSSPGSGSQLAQTFPRPCGLSGIF